MLTRFGKRFITNVLAGNIGITNKELVLGIGKTDATELDTRLEFEFFRIPVSFGSIDIQPKVGGGFNYYAIYKGTIPQDVAGEINEIGLFAGNKTSVNLYDNKFISDFENNLLWTDSSNTNPLFDQTVGAKIGGGMIKVDATTTPKEYSASVNTLDISGYSVNDSLTLAYYKSDNNLSSIKVRFYSSNTNYYEATAVSTPASGTGHRLAKIPFSTVLNGVSGTPDSTAIAKISVIVTASSGTTTVYFDGLRVNDEDTFDPTYGIIARSIITYSTTISGTSGTNTITVGSNSNLFIGQSVIGTGIGSNATITNISNSTVTLSVNNSGTVSGNGTFYGLTKKAGRQVDIEYKLGLFA